MEMTGKFKQTKTNGSTRKVCPNGREGKQCTYWHREHFREEFRVSVYQSCGSKNYEGDRNKPWIRTMSQMVNETNWAEGDIVQSVIATIVTKAFAAFDLSTLR